METRDHSFPGEFGQNTGEQDVERRFGEEAHAYERRRSQPGRQEQQGGMASSSATVGTGAPGEDSAYGPAIEGTQQGGGIGSADHGPEGTINSGSGAGLSSGNATGGATTGDDAHTTMPPRQRS